MDEPIVTLAFALYFDARQQVVSIQVLGLDAAKAIGAILVALTLRSTEVSSWTVRYTHLSQVYAIRPAFRIIQARSAEGGRGWCADVYRVGKCSRVLAAFPSKGAILVLFALHGTLFSLWSVYAEALNAIRVVTTWLARQTLQHFSFHVSFAHFFFIQMHVSDLVYGFCRELW
ncbi:MAG: hypothetical protein ACTSVD_01755 [Candidatus Thorarchaeota archaeon]